MTNSNTKKSRSVVFIALLLLAVIPAIAAWSQTPAKSTFKFAPETHVTHIAPMTVTDTDIASIPEVKITGRVVKPSRSVSKITTSQPVGCHLHELLQGGSPDAPHVLSCG